MVTLGGENKGQSKERYLRQYYSKEREREKNFLYLGLLTDF